MPSGFTNTRTKGKSRTIKSFWLWLANSITKTASSGRRIQTAHMANLYRERKGRKKATRYPMDKWITRENQPAFRNTQLVWFGEMASVANISRHHYLWAVGMKERKGRKKVNFYQIELNRDYWG